MQAMTDMTRKNFATMMAAAPAASAHKPLPARRLGKINFQAGMLGIGARYPGDYEIEQSRVNRVVASPRPRGIVNLSA